RFLRRPCQIEPTDPAEILAEQSLLQQIARRRPLVLTRIAELIKRVAAPARGKHELPRQPMQRCPGARLQLRSVEITEQGRVGIGALTGGTRQNRHDCKDPSPFRVSAVSYATGDKDTTGASRPSPAELSTSFPPRYPAWTWPIHHQPSCCCN